MGSSLLVDCHCHMDFFDNPSLVVEKSVKSGVPIIVSCSTGLESIKKHLLLQKELACIRICLGIHPSNLLSMSSAQVNSALELVKKNASKSVAIGEIGLDFKHASTLKQRALQENVFRKQIGVALENGLPVVVHGRFAEKRAMEILVEEGAKRVLMHWFTNFEESVQIASKNGFFMSCGPIILSSKPSLEIAKGMPVENLVLETDAPVAFLGKQSDPSWLPLVLEKLAVLKGMESQVLAQKTTKNAFSLFGLNG